MEKIIVEVRIAATGQTRDFEIPVESVVCDVAREMAEILFSTGSDIALDADTVQICDLDRHMMLRDEMTMLEAGVRDGSCLMLV